MQIQMKAMLKREIIYLHVVIPPVTFTALVVFVLFVPFIIITFLYSKN